MLAEIVGFVYFWHVTVHRLVPMLSGQQISVLIPVVVQVLAAGGVDFEALERQLQPYMTELELRDGEVLFQVCSHKPFTSIGPSLQLNCYATNSFSFWVYLK